VQEIASLNCRAHGPRFLACGQPSVDIRPYPLAVRELAFVLGNSVDVAHGVRKNRIIGWDHAADKILQFAGALVVRHEPYADAKSPWSIKHAARVGKSVRDIAIDLLECVRNGLLPTGKVVVGVRHDAQRFSPGRFDFNRNRLPERNIAFFVQNPEIRFKAMSPHEMFDDIPIATTLNDQQPGLRGRGHATQRTSIRCCAATSRSSSE